MRRGLVQGWAQPAGSWQQLAPPCAAFSAALGCCSVSQGSCPVGCSSSRGRDSPQACSVRLLPHLPPIVVFTGQGEDSIFRQQKACCVPSNPPRGPGPPLRCHHCVAPFPLGFKGGSLLQGDCRPPCGASAWEARLSVWLPCGADAVPPPAARPETGVPGLGGEGVVP